MLGAFYFIFSEILHFKVITWLYQGLAKFLFNHYSSSNLGLICNSIDFGKNKVVQLFCIFNIFHFLSLEHRYSPFQRFDKSTQKLLKAD